MCVAEASSQVFQYTWSILSSKYCDGKIMKSKYIYIFSKTVLKMPTNF